MPSGPERACLAPLNIVGQPTLVTAATGAGKVLSLAELAPGDVLFPNFPTNDPRPD